VPALSAGLLRRPAPPVTRRGGARPLVARHQVVATCSGRARAGPGTQRGRTATMPGGTRHASAPPTVALVTARNWAAEVREEARRLREESAATRAQLAAHRASRGGLSADWRSRLAAAEDRSAQLERALASNRRIGIAIGVLMTRLHLTDAEAFELLRQVSQKRNVKLRELAEDVIYTGSV
jgi:hypothetical protein